MIARCWRTGNNRIGKEAIPLPHDDERQRDSLGGREAWRIPRRGDLVQHYKGDYYVVTDTGTDSTNSRASTPENPKPVVVYYSLDKRAKHVRDMREFCEELASLTGGVPRFKLIARDIEAAFR